MNNIEASDDLSPPPGVSGGGPYAIFQNRDFTFYLISRLVGITGQQMFTIAILWEIYALTHSALALGLVGLVQMIPMFLFTLPAGHVADNYNRKRIVVLTTAAVAAASLGVAFVSWRHAPVIWIYFCLFARQRGQHLHAGSQRRFSAGVGGPEGFSAGGELERRCFPALLHRRPGGRRRPYRLDGLALFQQP